MSHLPLRRSLLAATLCLAALSHSVADEATIRRNIAQRLPSFPPIDEVSRTAIPGLYELRFGGDLMYTDENGDYLIQGNMLDTKARVDVTQARLDKINAVDFGSLPLQDALVWKQGTGARKLVVFADPNCGYCKKFETELQQVQNITVYTFLMPILGGNSPEMALNVWCAKDNATVWRNWMIQGQRPQRVMGHCDDGALARNLALGKKLHISLTPMLFFEDGKRFKGGMEPAQLERQLQASSRGRS